MPSVFRAAALALVAAGLVGAAHADVFPKEKLIKLNKDKPAGGNGVLVGEYAFTRDQPTKDQAIKEISWLTLAPGDSIGWHEHKTNEDTYIIVSGSGVFTDKDKREVPVKAGDVTIVRKGEGHALINNGKVPLVFVDVIAEQ